MKAFIHQPLMYANWSQFGSYDMANISLSESNVCMTPFNLTYFFYVDAESKPIFYFPSFDSQEYISRPNDIIVLQTKNSTDNSIMSENDFTRPKKEELKRQNNKCLQKQSRNVVSNVLRIFFKNTIEIQYYDDLIQRTLATLNSFDSKDQFYLWLDKFHINFKNYIRFSELKKVFQKRGATHFQKVLVVVLNHYLTNCALAHCLTSKRIEIASMKMHLQGLRYIKAELAKLTKIIE